MNTVQHIKTVLGSSMRCDAEQEQELWMLQKSDARTAIFNLNTSSAGIFWRILHFFILVRKPILIFFFFLHVNKDKGRGRKTVYCKFGMAGTVAIQGLKHYQTCSVQKQSVN